MFGNIWGWNANLPGEVWSAFAQIMFPLNTNFLLPLVNPETVRLQTGQMDICFLLLALIVFFCWICCLLLILWLLPHCSCPCRSPAGVMERGIRRSAKKFTTIFLNRILYCQMGNWALAHTYFVNKQQNQLMVDKFKSNEVMVLFEFQLCLIYYSVLLRCRMAPGRSMDTSSQNKTWDQRQFCKKKTFLLNDHTFRIAKKK